MGGASGSPPLTRGVKGWHDSPTPGSSQVLVLTLDQAGEGRSGTIPLVSSGGLRTAQHTSPGAQSLSPGSFLLRSLFNSSMALRKMPEPSPTLTGREVSFRLRLGHFHRVRVPGRGPASGELLFSGAALCIRSQCLPGHI